VKPLRHLACLHFRIEEGFLLTHDKLGFPVRRRFWYCRECHSYSWTDPGLTGTSARMLTPAKDWRFKP
jgi:hypothetical protein